MLEFGAVIRELIDRLDVLLLGVRLVTTLLELEVFLFVMTRLEMLLPDDRFVMAWLDVLLLGVRLVTELPDELLLGALLVTLLLELLLLGALLTDDRLVLRLDETLLERLDDDRLDEDLAAEDDPEDCRLELLELRLDRDDLAAKTGSQNNKRATKMHKTGKREPFCILYPVSCLLYSVLLLLVSILRLLSSALTTFTSVLLIKGKKFPIGNKKTAKNEFFHFF